MSKKGSGEVKYITKKHFLDYFRKPRPIWFLQNIEGSEFLQEKLVEENGDEFTRIEDLFGFLRVLDSDDHLFSNNLLKLTKILKKKLLSSYQKSMKIPKPHLRDYSTINEDKTQEIISLLKKPGDLFFFSPYLIGGDLKINPSAIYKYNGKIYLLEHFWATSLKRESIGTLIFYNHVLEGVLNIKIDHYILSYLSSKPSPDKELLIEFTLCLPPSIKKVYPTSSRDKRLSNVNYYFSLIPPTYENSLLQLIFSGEEYEDFVTRDWVVTRHISARKVIECLREFLVNEDRSIDPKAMARDYLSHRTTPITSNSIWFKLIFSRIFRSLTFSGNLMKFDKIMHKIVMSPETAGDYMKTISTIPFIDFPEDQDYIVFPPALSNFETLQNKSIKVYYDFETITLPFPYLKNTKPYCQIVLQLSLIRVRDDEEEEVVNMIVDPLSLSIEDFKKIIDHIFIDEPDVAYIVYNKSFENSRLREMAEMIDDLDYSQKVISIIDRTLDLAEWFAYGNHPFIIHKKLQGFHSIKKVIKLLTPEMEKKSGAIQYSDLKRCQNGLMAQSLLLERALSDDPQADLNNWEKNKDFMYRYCENDVRSMIAVELLIDELLRNNKYGFYDLEKFLEDKNNFKKHRLNNH